MSTSYIYRFAKDRSGASEYVSLMFALTAIVFVMATALMIIPIFIVQANIQNEAKIIARSIEISGEIPSFDEIQSMFINGFKGERVVVQYTDAENMTTHTVDTSEESDVQINLRDTFVVTVYADADLFMLFTGERSPNVGHSFAQVKLSSAVQGICEVYTKDEVD